MKKINGSGVALITPFNQDNTINFEKVAQLIEFHIENKTDFIVICGTTGESATLSYEEIEELIKFSVKRVNGRIPLIVGTGSNNTLNSIKMSKFAKDAGADGILVVTPYYNKGNDNGIYNHYKKIAKKVYPLPLILYNVPTRTGVDLKIPLILQLAQIENIVAIKEANSSIEKISSLLFAIKRSNLDFKVFSGNDNLTLPILNLGGCGVISVCANIIPNQMHKICKYKDLELFSKYYELMNTLFLDTNPIMIKEAMNLLNFEVGNVRLPLYHTTEKNLSILKNIINNLKIEYAR